MQVDALSDPPPPKTIQAMYRVPPARRELPRADIVDEFLPFENTLEALYQEEVRNISEGSLAVAPQDLPFEETVGDAGCKISGMSQPASKNSCDAFNVKKVAGKQYGIFTFVENSICLSTFTHLAAYRACSRIGARLCTAEEIWDNPTEEKSECAGQDSCVWSHCYGKHHAQYRMTRNGYCNVSDWIGVGNHQVGAVRCCCGPHDHPSGYHDNILNETEARPIYYHHGPPKYDIGGVDTEATAAFKAREAKAMAEGQREAAAAEAAAAAAEAAKVIAAASADAAGADDAAGDSAAADADADDAADAAAEADGATSISLM